MRISHQDCEVVENTLPRLWPEWFGQDKWCVPCVREFLSVLKTVSFCVLALFPDFAAAGTFVASAPYVHGYIATYIDC